MILGYLYSNYILQALINSLNGFLKPGGKLFRGWWIVLSASGIQMLAGVLWMQSFGAYVVLLQGEFGWSKAVIAGAFALTRVESGILGPLQGWLTDRFGPRLILRIGTILFGIGFMLFSQIETVLGFYLTFALIAIGSSLGGFATLMVSIVNWFDKNRAKAVAFSQIGYSFGGLCVPVVVFSLELFGWRATAFASGVIVIAVGLPLIQVIKHRPENGEYPDGIAPDSSPISADKISPDQDLNARQAMKTSAFWFISVGHALALLTVSAVMVHLVTHLIEGLNYTLGQAALVVSLMTACQMIGQLLGGYLGDRFNKRFICVLCMLGHGSGMLLVAWSTHPSMVIGFAVLNGLGWGTRGPLMVALRADYFGSKSFGTIMGFSSLIAMLGMSIGPVITGYVADLQGNYVQSFTAIAAASVVGALCFFFAKRPPSLNNVT
jgi:MFS family permease